MVISIRRKNKTLHFDANIAWLDFTYTDKRLVHLIKQKISTLSQALLTLLANKTIMEYDAYHMTDNYRADALRVLMSELWWNLTDTPFSTYPKDLHQNFKHQKQSDLKNKGYNRGQDKHPYLNK